MAEVSQIPTIDIDSTINRATTKQYTKRFLRGHGVIRQKSLRFIGILQSLGYVREVPLEKAKDIFQLHTDTWDRTSLKAYFGQLPGRSERLIDRTAHYATGTISIKKIRLRQTVEKKEGYLEKLGLINYELRGRAWFLLLKETSVVPEIATSSSSVNEASQLGKVSIDNFSLTPKAEGNGSEEASITLRLQKRESVIGRERNRLSESIRSTYLQPQQTENQHLTPAEKAEIEARDRQKPPKL